MMDLLANLATGFAVALSWENLLYAGIGVFFGTLLGVIPGIGTLAALSMLFPFTFYLDPVPGLIMLAGIYYGTTYGGSTSTILLNLPGTPANAVTALDGYPMSQQGRGGVALLMTTAASFFGATAGIVILTLLSPAIANLALSFGAAEYFSLMVLGLISASVVSPGSAVKGIAMVVLGMLLGIVGIDINSGVSRFTFGSFELMDGISLVALAMGLFGVVEIAQSIGNADKIVKPATSMRGMLPTRDDVRRSWLPMVRGAGIGGFLGSLPGVGSTVAAFIAYAVERRVAREPERFGKGAIEGIMAPETANNAADQTAFIPTLTLGIPGSSAMALILGVLMIHGISPGPQLLVREPELFWGLVASFWIGNILLVILNVPLVGVWVRVLLIPFHLLLPAVLTFVCIGVYISGYKVFDILVLAAVSLLGYGMRVFGFPAAPLLLGFVLGPMIEENFRRAMLLSQGSVDILMRPISATILLISVGLLVYGIVSGMRK